ncbi:hypothetical protein M8T12_04810 [Enterobacter ludwigii]|uniref:hypothetical protein n=1 Tax=Enterobacter ludwigii TaxID=299767 RepID=UPI000F843ADF|nr:hypothetical protein [Enterobacter ludwigii]MCM7780397.1 hypothetical protein [Enterobacter ludwigii]RTO52652.1 hypothetical protein EKN74_11195 [Enterobacter ludwigii]
MKQKFIEWFTKGNNGCAPSINADGSFEQEKTQHMFEAYQAGMAESDRKVEQLAAELSAVDAIHNDAVFITDDHYEQCPPEVQKIIRSLAVLQIPAYQQFLAEVRASAIEHAASEPWGSGYVFDELNDFAAKIRQEAQ